jgi:hypothetical protein
MKRIVLRTIALLAVIFLAASCSRQDGLPDLDVQEVGCQDGVLYLKFINNGPGIMPQNWTALASVSINGEKRDDILMERPSGRVDGGLDRPGGVGLYLTPYPVEEILRVDIALDYADMIKETHEDDNIRNNLYVAPCSLPDLVIEEVALDENCFLTLRLKNRGQGSVPKKAWSEEFFDYCGVSIYVGDIQWACTPFLSFDTRHDLEAAGGTLTYKTNLKIKDETMITAIVDATENLNESEEQNNKAVATLACKK